MVEHLNKPSKYSKSKIESISQIVQWDLKVSLPKLTTFMNNEKSKNLSELLKSDSKKFFEKIIIVLKNNYPDIYKNLEISWVSINNKWEIIDYNIEKAVLILQLILNILGYKWFDGEPILSDGIFGINTFFSVLNFQKNSWSYKEIWGKVDWLIFWKTLSSMLQDIERKVQSDISQKIQNKPVITQAPVHQLSQPEKLLTNLQETAIPKTEQKPISNEKLNESIDSKHWLILNRPVFTYVEWKHFLMWRDDEGKIIKLPINDTVDLPNAFKDANIQSKLETIFMIIDGLYINWKENLYNNKQDISMKILSMKNPKELSDFINEILSKLVTEDKSLSSIINYIKVDNYTPQQRRFLILHFLRNNMKGSEYVSNYITNLKLPELWYDDNKITYIMRSFDRNKGVEWFNNEDLNLYKNFDTKVQWLRNEQSNEIRALITKAVEKEFPWETQLKKSQMIAAKLDESRNNFMDWLKKDYLKKYILTNFIKKTWLISSTWYTWDDSLLRMFSDIEWNIWILNFSDKSLDIWKELAQTLAIEAAIMTIWTFSAHTLTGVLHGVVYGVRAQRIWRTVLWAWEFVSSLNVGKNAYVGVELLLQSAAFYQSTNVLHNIVKWNKLMKWWDDLPEMVKTFWLFSSLKVLSHLKSVPTIMTSSWTKVSNPFHKLIINGTESMWTKSIKFWADVVIEWSLFSWIETVGDLLIDGKCSWTEEELMQWILLSAVLKWCWGLSWTLNLTKKNWSIRVEEVKEKKYWKNSSENKDVLDLIEVVSSEILYNQLMWKCKKLSKIFHPDSHLRKWISNDELCDKFIYWINSFKDKIRNIKNDTSKTEEQKISELQSIDKIFRNYFNEDLIIWAIKWDAAKNQTVGSVLSMADSPDWSNKFKLLSHQTKPLNDNFSQVKSKEPITESWNSLKSATKFAQDLWEKVKSFNEYSMQVKTQFEPLKSIKYKELSGLIGDFREIKTELAPNFATYKAILSKFSSSSDSKTLGKLFPQVDHIVWNLNVVSTSTPFGRWKLQFAQFKDRWEKMVATVDVYKNVKNNFEIFKSQRVEIEWEIIKLYDQVAKFKWMELKWEDKNIYENYLAILKSYESEIQKFSQIWKYVEMIQNNKLNLDIEYLNSNEFDSIRALMKEVDDIVKSSEFKSKVNDYIKWDLKKAA